MKRKRWRAEGHLMADPPQPQINFGAYHAKLKGQGKRYANIISNLVREEGGGKRGEAC